MKHIGNELFNFIEQKRLVKKEVAEQVGITPVYLSAIMHKESIDAELLEKICKAIGVSPAYFFDDYIEKEAVGSCESIHESALATMTEREIDLLKSMLEEKERTIRILMQAKGIESGQQ